MNSKVDFYFSKSGTWNKELTKLRSIVLDCPLSEELKWGVPCYTLPIQETKQKKNIVLIHVFKEYCALLFFKGVLLKDAKGILIQQTENVQAARQVRFTNVREIVKIEKILKEYILEAIEIEQTGIKVPLKKTNEFAMTEEFQKQLDKNRSIKKAFFTLTPGRQRAYLLYFSQPKQSITRESRINKCIPQILSGKGLNDL